MEERNESMRMKGRSTGNIRLNEGTIIRSRLSGQQCDGREDFLLGRNASVPAKKSVGLAERGNTQVDTARRVATTTPGINDGEIKPGFQASSQLGSALSIIKCQCTGNSYGSVTPGPRGVIFLALARLIPV